MSKLETNTIDTISGTANLTIGGANNTGSTTIKTNNTDAVTIDNSQRVGIGTASPSVKLEITGADGDADAQAIRLMENTTQGGFIKYDGSANELKLGGYNSGENTGIRIARNDATTYFNTNGSERMIIRSDGMVGIGTTGGSSQLQVLLDSGDIAYFQNAAGTGAKITAGNNSFSSVSDENKKENITELNKQESYDNIKNIKAITYNFKDIIKTDENDNTTTYKDDKNRIGFIAQDWETNYSQLVDTDKDGVKSLLYTETTPVLLSALQKAQEKIEALEARITTLENK